MGLVDAYDLDEAVADKFLVPPTAVSVPLKFVLDGIRYDELSDEDKEKWDILEWEGGLPGGDIDLSAVNKWLFNQDTVDKVLEHLMTNGLKVAERRPARQNHHIRQKPRSCAVATEFRRKLPAPCWPFCAG